MTPSPQRAVLGSTRQMSEQPSPATALPSSQVSGPPPPVAADRKAAASGGRAHPAGLEEQVAEQPSPLVALLSSQALAGGDQAVTADRDDDAGTGRSTRAARPVAFDSARGAAAVAHGPVPVVAVLARVETSVGAWLDPQGAGPSVASPGRRRPSRFAAPRIRYRHRPWPASVLGSRLREPQPIAIPASKHGSTRDNDNLGLLQRRSGTRTSRFARRRGFYRAILETRPRCTDRAAAGRRPARLLVGHRDVRTAAARGRARRPFRIQFIGRGPAVGPEATPDYGSVSA